MNPSYMRSLVPFLGVNTSCPPFLPHFSYGPSPLLWLSFPRRNLGTSTANPQYVPSDRRRQSVSSFLRLHPLHPGNPPPTRLLPPPLPFKVPRRRPWLLVWPHPSSLPPLPPPHPPHQGHIPSTFSTLAQQCFTVTGGRGGQPISHLFLNLSCPQDTSPPDFRRDSLYAQWAFLSKHVDTHEVWCQTVLSFLASTEMQCSTRHTAADNKVGEALQQNNQKGKAGSTKSTENSGGGPDPSIYSFALYVRWSAKANTAYPMSLAKLAALLKDVFGQNEVCFITDDLLRGQGNGSKSGYTVIGAIYALWMTILSSSPSEKPIGNRGGLGPRIRNRRLKGNRPKKPPPPHPLRPLGLYTPLLHTPILEPRRRTPITTLSTSLQPPPIRCPHPLLRPLLPVVRTPPPPIGPPPSNPGNGQ